MSETTEKSTTKYVDPRDGVSFINITMGGSTALGRFLSNSSEAPFNHPEFGEFKSVIGFWKWLCAKDRDSVDNVKRTTIDKLRVLHGKEAIVHATKNVPQQFVQSFRQQIANAIWYKVKANEEMVAAIIENSLPFISISHRGDQKVPSANPNSDWLIPIYSSISEHLKSKGIEVPYVYVYPEYTTKRNYKRK